jgi:ankyrin repeat protein
METPGQVAGSGNTALHAAAFNGHEEMAQLLLDAGAEMRATTDGQRLTPLDYARHKQHTKVVRLLRAHAQKPKDKHRSSSKPGRKGRRSRRKKT